MGENECRIGGRWEFDLSECAVLLALMVRDDRGVRLVTMGWGAMKLRSLFGVSAACWLVLLAGCSSGARTSGVGVTTSTATTSPVNAFFVREGKPLLVFERATKELLTGVAPLQATCVRLTQQVLPKVIHDPNSLVPLTLRIPDAKLASAFRQDVSLRILVLLGCSRTTPVTGAAADPKAYTTVRDFAAGVKRLLAPYHIDI